MRVLVSGSSGLLGSALAARLRKTGNEVRRLIRSAPSARDEFQWDPFAGVLHAGLIEGVDAVVHLAGEPIDGRWTDSKKKRILESRTKPTRLLAETIASCQNKPPVLVCASASGYYGNRGDEVLTEQSAPGEGFIVDVVEAWEAAATAAADAGVRVVNTRFGIVLSPDGGMLGRILTPFKLGIGGTLGDGSQYMSWVAVDDAVAAIEFAIGHRQLVGPLNVTAPEPVTNRVFTKALGSVLRRPTLARVPRFAIRSVFGELVRELFASRRAVPELLTEAGFKFRYPSIERALNGLLR